MQKPDSLFADTLPSAPDFSHEQRLIHRGKQFIAGVDEAGRGPLAGPVVAAAVILDPGNIPDGLNDSKKLTEKKRETLFDQILLQAHVSWTSLSAATIDEINIREAALLAMTKSIQNLAVKADHALIDGRDIPTKLIGIGEALVKGDARSVSIAAASIIAKVVRDRMMIEVDQLYPRYGFAGHKGYGSKKHRDAIAAHGPCAIHRRSFSPIKQMVE